MKTTLLLIRHGETEWTRKKRYCGSNDVPLNSRGRSQLARLGKALETCAIDAAYCSDMRRARESARLALKDRKVTCVRGLREMDFGIFEGMTHGQIGKKYPALYAAWLKDFGSITPPDAESFRDFSRRVKRSFREIAAKNRGKTCAVVSHGGVMMVLLSMVAGKGKLWKFLPSLGSLSVIEIEGREWKLVSFNDTGHLTWYGYAHFHNRGLPQRQKHSRARVGEKTQGTRLVRRDRRRL
jgi:broad specificity phosphatase PhoE